MKEFLRFTVFVMSQFTRCFTFSACTCEGLKRRLFQLLIFFFPVSTWLKQKLKHRFCMLLFTWNYRGVVLSVCYKTQEMGMLVGNDSPLQYSCLENPMDGGAWLAAVHGVTRSQTRLSDFTFTFHFHALEKEMATHSSILAWRIPGTGEPGGLPSLGSHRVGHDWNDLAAAAAAAVAH